MKFKDILFKFTVEEIHQCWTKIYNDEIPKEAVEFILLQMKNKELQEDEGVIKVEVGSDIWASLYVYDEPYGFSFTPWGEILNTEVELINTTELEAVTVILYEVTWYGIEEEVIQAEIAELEKRIEEIDKGEAKTYTLEDLDDLFDK